MIMVADNDKVATPRVPIQIVTEHGHASCLFIIGALTLRAQKERRCRPLPLQL